MSISNTNRKRCLHVHDKVQVKLVIGFAMTESYESHLSGPRNLGLQMLLHHNRNTWRLPLLRSLLPINLHDSATLEDPVCHITRNVLRGILHHYTIQWEILTRPDGRSGLVATQAGFSISFPMYCDPASACAKVRFALPRVAKAILSFSVACR